MTEKDTEMDQEPIIHHACISAQEWVEFIQAKLKNDPEFKKLFIQSIKEALKRQANSK